MCLLNIKEKLSRTCYKIFKNSHLNEKYLSYFGYGRLIEYELGGTYFANNNEKFKILSYDDNYYYPGFHAYTSLEAAQQAVKQYVMWNYKILEVELNGITYIGMDGCNGERSVDAEVVVGMIMTLVREVV